MTTDMKKTDTNLRVVDTSSYGGARRVSEITTSAPYLLPDGAYETSQRKVSSIILHEEMTGKMPEPNIRYVEVPQYEEVIKHVSVKQTREIEKFVPKIIEEWVEKIVEVPQIQEVIKNVEVHQINEIIKHVPKVEIHDRYTEVIRHVPKIELRRIERVVEVPGEIIEVPKPFTVEESVPVAAFHDSEQMLIVAQTVKPVIVEGGKEIHVDVLEYEPEVVPVDIHVAKFVDQTLVAMGAKETTHRVVTVPAAQYNSMMRFLNVHLSESDLRNLPYLQDSHNQVKFLPQEYQWCAPPEGIKIYGYQKGLIYGEGSPIVSKQTHTNEEFKHRQEELDAQFQATIAQFDAEKERRLKYIEDFNVRSQHHCTQMINSGTTTTHHTTTTTAH